MAEEACSALHLSRSNYIGRGPRLVGCGMWDKFGERPQYVNKTCQFSKIPNHTTSHFGSLERAKCALFRQQMLFSGRIRNPRESEQLTVPKVEDILKYNLSSKT